MRLQLGYNYVKTKMFITYCLGYNPRIQTIYRITLGLLEKHNARENVKSIWDEPIKNVQP
jgi:hypothetical protein